MSAAGAGDPKSRRAGLRRAWLIAMRELRERVVQRAYVIALVIGSIVAAAAVVAPAILDDDDAQGSGSRDPEIVLVAFAPSAQGVEGLTAADLDAGAGLVRGYPVKFKQLRDEAAVKQAVGDGDEPLGLVVAGPQSAPSVRVISREDGGGMLVDRATQAVDAAALQARADSLGDVEPADLLRPAEVTTETVSGSGPTVAATAVVSVLGLLLYIGGILLTQAYATGIVTDRTNRVTERLLTAARPVEHLGGKLVGVGAGGLLQFAVWIAVALVADLVVGSGTTLDRVPAELIIWFPVALVLTYVLYAAAASVLVLPVRKAEDVGGATTPAVMLQVVGFIIATTIIAPGATVSRTVELLSLVPFFSPLLMLGRLAGGDVPAWELAVGVLGPLVFAALLLRLAAPAYARYAIDAPGGSGLKAVAALLRR